MEEINAARTPPSRTNESAMAAPIQGFVVPPADHHTFQERVLGWRQGILRFPAIPPREQLSDFARQFEWSFYITWTFRRPRRDPIALETTLRHYLGAFPPMLQPRHAMVGIEGHKSGFLHAHALLGPTDFPREWRDWKEEGYKRFGITRCYPYDADKGAAYYVAKYILKGEDGNWFWWSKGVH